MPLFTPIGGGGIGKATVTGTTGSPSVDTTTRAGKTIYRFTGSGSITVGTAGTAEVLVVGGGGAAGNGGGGAGGVLYDAQRYLPSGTLTVNVGAGGSGGNGGGTYAYQVTGTSGRASSIGQLAIALGGGNGSSFGGNNAGAGSPGGSGGGGNNTSGGSGFSGQGNAGSSSYYGGGGGAGAAATNSNV